MNTKEITKKYDERIASILRSNADRQAFMASILKMCPHCGALLTLSAKGCDSCLYQFGDYNDRHKR